MPGASTCKRGEWSTSRTPWPLLMPPPTARRRRRWSQKGPLTARYRLQVKPRAGSGHGGAQEKLRRGTTLPTLARGGRSKCWSHLFCPGGGLSRTWLQRWLHLGISGPARALSLRRFPWSEGVFLVEARRIELPNLLHAMQALYQLSYAPRRLPDSSTPRGRSPGAGVAGPFGPYVRRWAALR
jgi:hypothetical protein